jgi:hypothetical protein
MAQATVQIEGLEQLNRALKYVEKGAAKAVRDGFREAVEPVRDSAERLALADIRNMTAGWARMRVGITTKEVYVAPASRRADGTGRSNVGRLLMERAMFPAVKKHEAELVGHTEKVLDDLSNRAGL